MKILLHFSAMIVAMFISCAVLKPALNNEEAVSNVIVVSELNENIQASSDTASDTNSTVAKSDMDTTPNNVSNKLKVIATEPVIFLMVVTIVLVIIAICIFKINKVLKKS